MEIIRDLLWLWILGALGGTGYILWTMFVREPAAPAPAGGRVQQQITTRRIPVAPSVAPSAAPSAASAAQAGVRPQPPLPAGEHQRRGAAPTVKLSVASPVVPDPSADAAAADLFGGLSAAKADAAPPIAVPAAAQLAESKGSVELAERIEERGFHVGAGKIEPAEVAPQASETLPGQTRSQTAELDDILKRIDAVLSESNAPQSEATLSGQQGGNHNEQTMPLAQPSPPTAKHERKQTDPSQQKLF
jgi:hypothetical protein